MKQTLHVKIVKARFYNLYYVEESIKIEFIFLVLVHFIFCCNFAYKSYMLSEVLGKEKRSFIRLKFYPKVIMYTFVVNGFLRFHNLSSQLSILCKCIREKHGTDYYYNHQLVCDPSILVIYFNSFVKWSSFALCVHVKTWFK